MIPNIQHLAMDTLEVSHVLAGACVSVSGCVLHWSCVQGIGLGLRI